MPPMLRRSIVIAFVLALVACPSDPPAQIGAPCPDAERRACVGNQEVVCRGSWQVSMSCTGPKACKRVKLPRNSVPFTFCDFARARVGMPCSRDYETAVRCSEDGKSRLVCRGGAWQTSAPCLGGGCGQRQEGVYKTFLTCQTAEGRAPEETLIESSKAPD
jgi:hypothetical protein